MSACRGRNSIDCLESAVIGLWVIFGRRSGTFERRTRPVKATEDRRCSSRQVSREPSDV